MVILYETRRGFTLTVARAMRDEIRGRGHLATTAPIRNVDPGTLAAADVLIVGSWTKGLIVVRVGPADGALEGIAALPDLGGLPAAVFCTCDVVPRGTLGILAARLRRRGARVLVEHAFRRRKSLRQVPAFVDLVLDEAAAARADRASPLDVPVAPAPGLG